MPKITGAKGKTPTGVPTVTVAEKPRPYHDPLLLAQWDAEKAADRLRETIEAGSDLGKEMEALTSTVEDLQKTVDTLVEELKEVKELGEEMKKMLEKLLNRWEDSDG